MAGEDPSYMAFLRTQPCAVPLCTRRCFDPHHSTNGSTVSPDDVPRGKQLGGRRGKGQRAHDHFAFTLCKRHHDEFHDERGHFAGWTKQERRAWQDEQVSIHRARYALHLEKHPLALPLPSARAKRVTARRGGASAEAEREAILKLIENYASDARHHPEAVAACDEIRVLIEARGEGKEAVS